MNKSLILFAFLAVGALCAPARADEDPRVRRTWKAKCASCHGEDGKGQTAQAKEKFGGLRDLSDPEVQKRFDDAKLKEVITKGTTETKDGKEIKMKGTPELQGEQLEGLVKLVRGLVRK